LEHEGRCDNAEVSNGLDLNGMQRAQGESAIDTAVCGPTARERFVGQLANCRLSVDLLEGRALPFRIDEGEVAERAFEELHGSRDASRGEFDGVECGARVEAHLHRQHR
jgi:hypothetical protein